LTIWCWQAAVDALAVADDEFQSAYPNIELNYEIMDTADVYQKIQLAVAAGGGFPDIACIESGQVGQFVELGALADLTDRVAPFVDNFLPHTWKVITKDGRYFGIPWDSGPVGIFYRRDVFEQAGVDPASIETWEDYYEAAKVIKEKTGVPMWPQPTGQNDARLFEMLLWQQGLGYVDDSGAVILDKDPRIEQTLEFMDRFWKEELAATPEWWTDAWYKTLADGEVATVVEAVWLGSLLKSFIAPDTGGLWGVFKMPVWEPGGSQGSIDGDGTVGIFADSEQQDAAWAYLQFHFATETSQLDMYREKDIFPALQTTYSDPFFQEPDPYFGDQQVRALFTEIEAQVPEGGVYNTDYALMNQLTAAEIQKFALGEQSASEALANAAQAIRDKTGRS
jgi:ABC-type glycerol-3-phosphate transport system substrate-binding protein